MLEPVLLRREAHRLRRDPGRSRGLVTLTLLFAALMAMYVRRFGFGGQDWLPLGPPNLSAYPPGTLWVIRHFLAEPRFLLGIVVAMWTIEDVLRQQERGELDDLVLSGLEGREILGMRLSILTRWSLLPVGAAIAMLTVDSAMLAWHNSIGLRGMYADWLYWIGMMAESLLVIRVAALVAYEQALRRHDAFEMLRHSAWRLFLASAGVAAFGSLLHWLLRLSPLYAAGTAMILAAWLFAERYLLQRAGSNFRRWYSAN
jgi:hypothetical protein